MSQLVWAVMVPSCCSVTVQVVVPPGMRTRPGSVVAPLAHDTTVVELAVSPSANANPAGCTSRVYWLGAVVGLVPRFQVAPPVPKPGTGDVPVR